MDSRRLINAKHVYFCAFCDPHGPSPGRTWQPWNPAHLPGHTAEPNNPELEVRHQEDEAVVTERGVGSKLNNN